MKVLFLILNYKTYQDTIRLTKELIAEGLEDKFVLIVDNASPNESFIELLSHFAEIDNVEIIQSPENGGYAKGNNFGLRYAKKYNPEYVCIINNDVHFTSETIDYLVNIYPQLPNAGVISPLQVLPGDKVAQFPILKLPDFEYDIRSYCFLFDNPQHKYQRINNDLNVQGVGVIPGAFLFAKYQILEDIDFFDESTFLFCEERFLSKRIQDAGLKNYIVLDKSYTHEHSKTINSEASARRQMKMMLAGRLLYTKKYRSMPHLKCALLHLGYYYCVAWHSLRGVLKKH